MANKTHFSILTSFTLFCFIVFVTLSCLSNTDISPRLFPKPLSNVTETFKLLVTPVQNTCSIWILIYIWQFAWLFYVFISNFRRGDSTEILKESFYVNFIVSTCFMAGWLFAWTREKDVVSFIIIVLGQIFLEVSFVIASTNLHKYEEENPMNDSNKADIWCQRILVQNGILFYATWTTVVTLVNTAIVLNSEVGASDQTASLVVLVVLTVIVIVWFFMESFYFEKYTDYTFSAYIAFIWALSGIFHGVWKKNDPVGGLTLALLIMVIILFIVRVVLIAIRPSSRQKAYDTISYNAQEGTVRT